MDLKFGILQPPTKTATIQAEGELYAPYAEHNGTKVDLVMHFEPGARASVIDIGGTDRWWNWSDEPCWVVAGEGLKKQDGTPYPRMMIPTACLVIDQ